MLNKVMIIGNLGRDPELRETASGQSVCNFSVATTNRWTTAQGEQRESREWFRVTAWGRLGETCNEYLSKGRQVYVEGRLQTSEWTDNDGNKRTGVDVVAQQVKFLGQRGSVAPRGPGDDLDIDEIPF